MKTRILSATALAVLVTLSGCGSNPLSQNSSIAPGANATAPISEQTATSDFARQGISIKYSLWSGAVESIEVVGYAPVWGNSQNAQRESFRVAELEAKKSLNDFINRENITSRTSVRMISSNLEQANDNKKNNFTTNVVKSSDDNDVAADLNPQKNAGSSSKEDNTAVRNDALRIASAVNNTITTQNAGILSGLYLVKGEVINSGKNVKAVYRWDKKSNSVRPVVRGLMMQ
jgi:predicted small lipoprotein YifL